jgi:hypothetical protein
VIVKFAVKSNQSQSSEVPNDILQSLVFRKVEYGERGQRTSYLSFRNQ